MNRRFRYDIVIRTKNPVHTHEIAKMIDNVLTGMIRQYDLQNVNYNLKETY